ncbi:MAG: hypothetical protein Q8J78_11725 [Moraxellaceae bacterium]|nr:hypothetical protein [Moraxellaceae bacterium]
MNIRHLSLTLGSLLLLAVAPAQASLCKAKPFSLPAGTPATGPGPVYHYTQPYLMELSASKDVLLSAEHGGGSGSSSEATTSHRIILWDADTLTPLRMYYSPAGQRNRPLPPNAVPLRGGYSHVALSPDGRRLAVSFHDKERNESCTDVYEDGVHINHYRDRRLLAFFRNDLVLAEDNKALYLQTPGPKGKSVKLWSIPGPLQSYSAKAVGNGRYIRFGSSNTFDVDTRKPLMEKYCNFKCTDIKPDPEAFAAYQAILPIDGHGKIAPQRKEPRKDGKAWFLHNGVEFVHEGPEQQGDLFARLVGDDYLVVQWKQRAKQGNETIDSFFIRIYERATGDPLHANPISTPAWNPIGSSELGVLVMLNPAEMLLVPSHMTFQNAERISLIEEHGEPVAIMRPPSDTKAAYARDLQRLRDYLDGPQGQRNRAINERAAAITSKGPESYADVNFLCTSPGYGADCKKAQQLWNAKRTEEAANARRAREREASSAPWAGFTHTDEVTARYNESVRRSKEANDLRAYNEQLKQRIRDSTRR